MRPIRVLLVLAVILLLPAAARPGGYAGPTHPSQLPPLAPDTEFPRCTPEDLVSAGFPDHLHAQWWPDWQVKTDARGVTYGPGAFCRGKVLSPREGLVVGEAEKRFGNFVVRHNPAYAPCDMLPLLEMLIWAAHDLEQLLGLTTGDTLTVVSPDNVAAYREQTGQGVWRLYALQGDTCIVEPYGTLQARTLDGHAGFMLVTDWLLNKNIPGGLPPWLHQGLVEYMAEDGVHLVNYMQQFRAAGNPLFSPPLIDAILSRGPDPDPGRDREMYRRACYSSFLMVWRLVEDRGGLTAMRRFLDLAAGGTDPDRAASDVYGAPLGPLANQLDPARLGEPLGDAVQSRSPQVKP